MKKILVAVNDAEASSRAVDFVEKLFDPDDVSITAVNIARNPVDWLPTTP